jgi:RNA polymerase sigma-70 factor (ECF subfamily)
MTALETELHELPRAPAADAGEPPAIVIGRLYEEHSVMVRALCQLLLRDRVEAEDAAQQTFLSAFGSLLGGTVPERPAPWLATIARRECWARSAQRRRQPLLLDDTSAAACPTGDALEEAIRKADLTALWAAIHALPRQQRAAFLMREFSGLSYAQVAEALGASESSVESLLVRARRQLRDGLAPTVRIANGICTPVLLLRNRFARMLGFGIETHAAAGAAAPLVGRAGLAVVAVAVASGSVGVGVGVHELRHTGASGPKLVRTAAVVTPVGWTADALVFGAETVRSLTDHWAPTAVGIPVGDSTAAGGAAPAGQQPGGSRALDGSVLPTAPSPADAPAGPAPADGAAAPAQGAPADPTAPPDSAPADATPADTTPAVGVSPAADTSTPADTTPPVDTSPPPADPAPSSDAPPPDPAAPDPVALTADESTP